MAVAAALVDAVADAVLPRVRAGMTERELAGEIARELWARGADREAHILVAAGARAALHHQTPGDAAVRAGESMLVDMATSVDGHWADITRQVFLGEADAEYARAYALVAAAEEAGVQAARPGVTAHELNEATLSVLHDAGYGRWAAGRTGHGIGREVHEDLIADDRQRHRAGGRHGRDRRAGDLYRRALRHPDRGHRRGRRPASAADALQRPAVGRRASVAGRC